MTVLLYVLAYVVGIVVLLTLSVFGFLSLQVRGKYATTGIATLVFSVIPLMVYFANFVVPVVASFVLGIGVVGLGAFLRNTVIQYKDKIFEEIAKNLQDRDE